MPSGCPEVVGLEKGTDCAAIAVERWLSGPKIAKKKKVVCPLIILHDRRAVKVFATNVLYQITIACIQYCT